MTREQKLALLMGFALVLVVAVLVSDHLSSASRAELGSIVAEAELPVGSSDEAVPDPIDQSFASNARPMVFGREPEPTPQQAVASRSAGDALRDAIAAGADESETSTPLATRIRQSMSSMPTAAQTDRSASSAKEEPKARVSTHPASRRYTVRENDSLWRIAAREYGDGHLHSRLAAYNAGRIGDDGEILVGSELLIPSRAELESGAPGPRERALSKRELPKRESASKIRRYTVKRGDTLGEIAASLLGSAKRWPEIVDLNADVIDDPESVPVGAVLKIPAR